MHGAAKSAWLSPKPDVSGGGFVRSKAGGARITVLPLYVENATRWNPGSSGVDPGPVYSVSTKVRPIRLFWIQATRHSRTDQSFAMIRRKRWGTNAGFLTSMAARCWSGQGGREPSAHAGRPRANPSTPAICSSLVRDTISLERWGAPFYLCAGAPRIDRLPFPASRG